MSVIRTPVGVSKYILITSILHIRFHKTVLISAALITAYTVEVATGLNSRPESGPRSSIQARLDQILPGDTSLISTYLRTFDTSFFVLFRR